MLTTARTESCPWGPGKGATGRLQGDAVLVRFEGRYLKRFIAGDGI